MDYVIDGKKVIFNVSSGLPNYSQKNNKYILQRKNNIVNHINVCNTTGICMGSSYAGWIFPDEPYPEYEQEEDRLTAFCLENKEVSDFYKRVMPALWKEWQDDKKDALPPNQVHRVLEYATNLWFGTKVVGFSEKISIEDMLSEIIHLKLPVVVSGKFPKYSGSSNTIDHIVVLVGAIYDKKDITFYDKPKTFSFRNNYNFLEPTHLIFDDPWGNFIEGYEKNLPGNDIICPYDKAISYLKPINVSDSKWGYVFKRGAAIS
jgi:hypothetical protein